MLVLELGHRERIDELTFAPDGDALVANMDSGMCIWPELADRRSPDWFPESKFLGNPRFTPDGRWLFAGTTSVRRFDPETFDHAVLPVWDPDGVIWCELSPTEPLMLVTQPEVGAKGVTRVALWRCDDLSRKGKLWQRDFPDSPFRIWPQFLPGGDRFARVEYGFGTKSTFEYRLAVFDTATGKPLGKPTALPHGGTISPDGRWLVDRNSTSISLHPLDPSAGRAARIRNDSKKHFTDFAFHPSGRYLAATSNDHTVKLYETETWAEARAFTWKLGKMRCVAFSPDGALAAAGTDTGKVVVWDFDP